jgi:hypothetical protein
VLKEECSAPVFIASDAFWPTDQLKEKGEADFYWRDPGPEAVSARFASVEFVAVYRDWGVFVDSAVASGGEKTSGVVVHGDFDGGDGVGGVVEEVL